MTLQEQLEAVEREIRGIDVELHHKRPLHRSLSIDIQHLEDERQELVCGLRRINAALNASWGGES